MSNNWFSDVFSAFQCTPGCCRSTSKDISFERSTSPCADFSEVLQDQVRVPVAVGSSMTTSLKLGGRCNTNTLDSLPSCAATTFESLPPCESLEDPSDSDDARGDGMALESDAGDMEQGADENPKFEFMKGALSQEELRGIQAFAEEHLGPDKSSAHFMRRRKAIAFVFVLNGRVYSLQQNYFVQHEGYNDFSGGYRREFAKIDDKFLQNELRPVVLRFVDYNKIADKEIMLIQVQTSVVDGADMEEFTRQGSKLSITGQGIHTDGHEKAMLACVRRKNVAGAMNQYYDDLDGEHPLCEPRILEEGDVSFFQDNELYHYVSPAGPATKTDDMARTMLLMHYPAEESLIGASSTKNNLGSRKSVVKLRDSDSLAPAHET